MALPLTSDKDHIVVDAGSAEATSLLASYGNVVKEFRERSRAKWDKLGWLGKESEQAGFPALKSEESKNAMAMLLENQNQFQLQHTPRLNNGFLLQDTSTADEALPTKFALPIVRRVYALMLDRDFGVVQPLPGPTGYVFWLDFIREQDTTNILSIEYTAFVTAELGVPQKGKLVLNRTTLTVQKQLMGSTWSLEAVEDARAQLGLDIEQELMSEWSNEFVRNLFGRHLAGINFQANSGTATGASLTTPWVGPNTQHTIAARGANTLQDYKILVYNALIDADTDHVKANRYPADGIICGYGLAGLLQKLETATQAQSPTDQNTTALGITDYGTFAGRWRVWGTDFVKDDQGFMYKRNPSQLQASHVYAPYIPIQVMPAIYGDYDTTTGNYQNRDAYTRNIRERSTDIVTKPYGFQPIKAASLAF
jgi:hypothetical protein